VREERQASDDLGLQEQAHAQVGHDARDPIVGARALACVQVDLRLRQRGLPMLDHESQARPARHSLAGVSARIIDIVRGEPSDYGMTRAHVSQHEQIAAILGLRDEARQPQPQLTNTARIDQQHTRKTFTFEVMPAR
jgi:hypothetical protein